MAPWRRHRPPPPKPWRFDWRNPNMNVVTRSIYENSWGFREKVEEELEPEDMQQRARESMRDSPTPKYREDPSYNWAKNKRR